MRPPEPLIAFHSKLMATATAKDGMIVIDGHVFTPEHVRVLTQHLDFLADAAEKQRDYEHERQARSQSLEI